MRSRGLSRRDGSYFDLITMATRAGFLGHLSRHYFFAFRHARAKFMY